MVKKRIELTNGAVKASVVEADVERFERMGYSKPAPKRRTRASKPAPQEGGDE